MNLSERQRRMLLEMGIRVWAPAAPAGEAPAGTTMPQAAGRARAAAPAALEGAAAASASASRPASASGAALPAAGSEERARAVAAMSWPQLREAVASCTACGLCRGRRQTVFGVGHEQAQWMIVGEAPGEQEDLKGEPFVGPAGQLLDNMLRALGLSRAEGGPERRVYIANTLKCRPPRNRNPEAAELAMCEPFLERQIDLIRPRLILAMGRFAVQSLLRSDEPVGKLRGRVHRYRGVPLIVTYHPAYLLRSLHEKARAWEDLCLAAQTMEVLPPP